MQDKEKEILPKPFLRPAFEVPFHLHLKEKFLAVKFLLMLNFVNGSFAMLEEWSIVLLHKTGLLFL